MRFRLSFPWEHGVPVLGLLTLWVEGYIFSLSIISFLAEAIGKNRSLEMMMSVTTQDPTPESVWALVREVSRQIDGVSRQIDKVSQQQEETDRQMQETDRQMQETDRQMQETDQKIQETALQMKETDRKMQETDRQIQELRQEIKEAKDLFTTQWGKLIESLVEGRLIELLNQRGIPVYDTSSRVKGNRDGRSYEFDIVAHDGEKVVIVEVKTTLRPDDVRKFVKKLGDAKALMPRYRDNIVHGAMAWLQANAGADTMAINQRLFSIRAVGDSATITNKPDFEPKVF
uniref:DUF3782 domain-containing protein n=1 Tax=Candidatus Kentrum sp. UNK TaxID=2126344 RepID=A0A451AUJ1_9GAMM|nr:MAG: Uncharacterised protein family UPF0102 [Candidatus Kentron sp. UNK]VFK69720.1 MAG: Uncharacterised protein family UPF0102 [Candidatus Kentron sp. UNK]